MFRESDIVYENQPFWVLRNKAYEVLKSGTTHSVVLAAFPLNKDGLSLAKYYADYMHKRNKANES